MCWYIPRKAAEMARLADYFIVVGYDQEKAGKCVEVWSENRAAEVLDCCPGRHTLTHTLPPCVDAFSFTLATQLPSTESVGHFCIFKFND